MSSSLPLAYREKKSLNISAFTTAPRSIHNMHVHDVCDIQFDAWLMVVEAIVVIFHRYMYIIIVNTILNVMKYIMKEHSL